MTTYTIRTRSGAPLMIVAITDRSYCDMPTLVTCQGYAWSATTAATRARRLNGRRTFSSRPGPRTEYVVRPIERGRVTVEVEEES